VLYRRDFRSRALRAVRAAEEAAPPERPARSGSHAPERPRNTFRLGFSSIPVEKLAPGIEKLAQIIDRMG